MMKYFCVISQNIASKLSEIQIPFQNFISGVIDINLLSDFQRVFYSIVLNRLGKFNSFRLFYL